ncbi:MAG: MoxR family ATPase [Candidatus Omnitrophica bacterium]|nr:MoxR family ATPase [Candidatus Omnitrophota bacterium]
MSQLTDELDVYQKKLKLIHENLSRVIRGKPECVEVVTMALLAGGSVLIEDVPGVGKTTLAKALARSLDASFNRIQFTPDLLPADILGSSVYNPVDGSFAFRQGPIFCNVLLADEINRASPRTQSALLEAMSEKQATIEGRRYTLPELFLVLATENPIEFHGTYPLPEAQLDRFLILLSIGYPAPEVEKEIFYLQIEQHPLELIKPVLSVEEVLRIQQQVKQVKVQDSVAGYIVNLAQATRQDSRLRLGVSPRGSLMLFRAAQSFAFLSGRDFVLPDDVQYVAPYVLSHRILLTSKARYGGASNREIIQEILREVKVPT